MNALEDELGQPLCADCGKGLDGEPRVTLVDIGGHPLPVCEECWLERRKPLLN